MSVGFESSHIMTPYSDKSLRPPMPVEGAEGCCKFLVATEAWKNGGVASGVPPGSLRGDSPPKRELEVGRGVLCRRSESSREPLGLFGVSEGSHFSSKVVMGELAVMGVATSDGISLVGGAWELGG